MKLSRQGIKVEKRVNYVWISIFSSQLLNIIYAKHLFKYNVSEEDLYIYIYIQHRSENIS